ncbi:MAG TPA: hypothetical protein ENF43_00085 [Thermoplasmatales archaeon]|nr:hypothetical protein [Thermoplasmatales archaeon]
MKKEIRNKLLEAEKRLKEKDLEMDRQTEEIKTGKDLFIIGDVAFLSNRLATIWNRLIDIYWDVKNGRKSKQLIAEFHEIKKEVEEMRSKIRYTDLWKRWKATMNLIKEIESYL